MTQTNASQEQRQLYVQEENENGSGLSRKATECSLGRDIILHSSLAVINSHTSG